MTKPSRCNNHNHHKLCKLLKIAQTQMRLFPHQVIDTEKEAILVNIVDTETAICSVCDEQMLFDATDMILIPDEYSGEEDQNLYADSYEITGRHYNIRINPRPAEEWQSQNQEEAKTLAVGAISKLSGLFKSIGKSAYSAITEKPYIVRPDFTGNDVATRVGGGVITKLDGSIVTVESDGPVGFGSVTSWIVNTETGAVDYKDDIARAPLNYSNTHVALHKLNKAIKKEFTKRFVELFTSLNGQKIMNEFDSEFMLQTGFLQPALIDFIKIVGGDIEGNDCVNLFKSGIGQTFLTASDDLEAAIGHILRPETKVSTNGNFSRSQNRRTKEEYMLPVCNDCTRDLIASCDDCGKYKYKTEMQSANDNGRLICGRCAENYSYCDDCSRMITSDESYWDENNTATYCESCYEEHKAERIDTSDFSEPKERASERLFFPSGNKQILQKLVAGLEILKGKTRGGTPDRCSQDFLNAFKANGFKEDEAISLINTVGSAANLELMGNPVGAEDFKWYIQSYITAIQNSIYEQDSFYSKYPLAIDAQTNTQNIFSGKKLDLIRGYQPMPVTYEYDEANRGESNFVIKMMPGKTLLEQAETLFPKFGKESWRWFSRTGTQHHPGCIAYARIASYDDYFVIDNFQRDADANNGKPEDYADRFSDPADKLMAQKAIKWWDKRTTRWYVQFAAYLVSFAEHNDKKLYLTNFETQKKKWSRLPEKNREVYDNLPEEMSSASFYKKLRELRDDEPELTAEELKERVRNGEIKILPTHYESFDGNVEDLSRAVGGIWRLAKRHKIFGLFKKAHSF